MRGGGWNSTPFLILFFFKFYKFRTGEVLVPSTKIAKNLPQPKICNTVKKYRISSVFRGIHLNRLTEILLHFNKFKRMTFLTKG